MCESSGDPVGRFHPREDRLTDQGPEVGAGYHLKVWRTARSQPPTPAAAFLRGGASAFRRHIGRKGSRHLPGWSSSRAAVNLIIASGLIHPSTSTSAAELGGEDGTVIGAAPSAPTASRVVAISSQLPQALAAWMEHRAGAAPHLSPVCRTCRRMSGHVGECRGMSACRMT